MNYELRIKKRGFTIIESLVAITILVIAVTGPLALASKGLAYSNYVKNEITAFYLANEAMDVVRNIRDTNLKTGVGFNNSLVSNVSGIISEKYKENLWGKVDVIANNNPVKINDSPDSDCKNTKLQSGKVNGGDEIVYGYNLNFSSYKNITDTSFSRCITITPLGTPLDEIRVTVTVSWMSGSINREVKISNNLFKLQ